MSSSPANQRSVFLGAAGLVVLFAAGMVLASSWLWSFPAEVLVGAWLVAFAAMATVIIYTFRESRATGTGFHCNRSEP